MALPIITAIRQRRDLKESLTHTAQELAHLASIYGIIRVSYTELARKCRCSRRTVMRHIQRLEDLRILRKTVLWIRGNFCETNTYAFVIAWDKSRPKRGSDKVSSILPPQEGEKNASLQEDIKRLKKGLTFCCPGTEAWDATCEKIARLEALLPQRE
jgi:DNA-binding Lrp family transcriptional regulator